MKISSCTMLILLTAFHLSYSQSLKIHLTGGSQQSFPLSQIDSITFTTSSVNLGLLAYYPLNGTAGDSSGNGNHGTIVGGVSDTTDRHGTPASAKFFNGASGYVLVPASNHPLGNANFSYACWVRSINGSYPNWRPIIDVGSSTTAFRRSALMAEATNSYHVVYTINSAFVRFGYTLPGSQWVHLVFTKQGNSVSLYVNGVLSETGQVLNQDLNNSQMRFGGNNDSQEFFQGAIDDIRIYNRALSAGEVQELFNQ